jgi:hypothetical protein
MSGPIGEINAAHIMSRRFQKGILRAQPTITEIEYTQSVLSMKEWVRVRPAKISIDSLVRCTEPAQ